eukprot:330778_1
MVKNNIAFWISVILALIYINLYECKRDSKSKNSPLASTKSDRNIELQGCKCKGYLQWTSYVLSYPMNVTLWATINKKPAMLLEPNPATLGDIVSLEPPNGQSDLRGKTKIDFYNAAGKLVETVGINTRCRWFRQIKVGWGYGPLTLVAGEHEKGPLCHKVCTTPNQCNKKRSFWSKVFSPWSRVYHSESLQQEEK